VRVVRVAVVRVRAAGLDGPVDGDALRVVSLVSATRLDRIMRAWGCARGRGCGQRRSRRRQHVRQRGSEACRGAGSRAGSAS